MKAWRRGERIYIQAGYEHRLTCKALPGARWDPEAKAWHIPATPSASFALRRSFEMHGMDFDEATKVLIREHQAAQKAKTSEDLPDIPGKTTAWQHQRQAFHFAKDLPGSMLAMDMGTGKSRTGIGLLEEWKAESVLILCPKSVTGVWPKQFELHAEREWKVIVPPSKATVANRAHYAANEIAGAKLLGQPYALVVNYESSWRDAMKVLVERLSWDVLLLDESHRIKSAGGKASLFVSRLRDHVPRRLALTGTPMPHSPLDIYAQYRALDPGVFGTSANRFKARYAIMQPIPGKNAQRVIGWQNEEELAQKFGALAFVCRKDEVLDLPEYQHIVRTCELEPKTRRVYRELSDEMYTQLDEGVVTAANAGVKFLRLQQVTGGFLRTAEGEDVSLAGADKYTEKQELFADVLEDLAPHEPVVVFARFHHDLDSIREVGEKSGRRVKELSGRLNELNADSTMPEDCDILAVQIQAGGVGIDLTRASYSIYYSVGFSLGDYEQSLARVHRPGQTRNVVYIHLVAEQTIDEKVYRALSEKKNVVEAVIEESKKEGTL